MSNKTADDTSMIRFNCPGCGKRLKAPADKVGRNSKCHSCGTSIVIPQGDSEEELLSVNDDQTPPAANQPSSLPLSGSVPPPLPPFASGPPPLPPQLAAPLATLAMEEKPYWYYSVNGTPSGPLTKSALAPILQSMSSNSTLLISRDGMNDWKRPEQCAEWKEASSGLNTSSSNPYIWILCFAPIFQEIITFVFGIPFTLKASVTIYAILNGSLATLDQKQLKQTGQDSEKLNKWWGLILVPIYLYQRGKYVQRQNYTFLIIWCVVFVVSVGLSTIPAFNMEHGHYLAMGNLDVWYRPPVTEWQATKVGQMLVQEGLGKNQGASVQILKESVRFQVKVVTLFDTEHELQAQAFFMRRLVYQLQICLDSKDVEIHLCDRNLNTKKVVNVP